MFQQRASIELEYGNKLAKLANQCNFDDLGSFGDVLDTLKLELQKTAKVHVDAGLDTRLKIEKPIQDFFSSQNTIRKQVC